MSLRAKTYVAISWAAIFAVALVFAAIIYSGRTMIHVAERNAATAAMQQASREIDAAQATLDALARDWGSWNDSVNFVHGRDPD